MTKKKEIEEKPTITVSDQSGNVVKVFDSVEEAYKFAGENGYQVQLN